MHGRRRPPPRSTRLGPSELERLRAGEPLVHGGFLVTGGADAPRALELACTHLGCPLELDRATGQLACPCHGSRFALDGAVLAGPATRPLAAAAMRRDADGWQVVAGDHAAPHAR